jgi:hypothetical protein
MHRCDLRCDERPLDASGPCYSRAVKRPNTIAALYYAASMTFSSALLAQNGSSTSQADAGPGDCTASAEPHECAERCPSFDTCYVAAGGGRLYYRVEDQRFECKGLECGAASQALGDYCCERGEFAPNQGGGDGCALAAPPRAASLQWIVTAAVAASVALMRRRER